jgi:dTDP-glucose 4,6-dehydratase
LTTDNVLVTGGAGFIGSHIVDGILARSDTHVTVLDRLSLGGSRFNLAGHAADPRLELAVADVQDAEAVDRLVSRSGSVIHAAAESHVDRSLEGPLEFVLSNVLGTQNVLESCRKHGVRMLMVSTDEVYGPGDVNGGLFDEDHPLRPRSPYAASKAAADMMCQAYVATYGAHIQLVRGTNAYGPRQIEKVIPTYAINAIEGSLVPVYGDGSQRREFLHVTDWARAALTVFDSGEPGVVYNIGGGQELSNLELAERICDLSGAPRSLIGFVEDRPGHDFRYGVSSDRLRSLGWRPTVGFDEGLADTVQWYRENIAALREAHGTAIVTAPRTSERAVERA